MKRIVTPMLAVILVAVVGLASQDARNFDRTNERPARPTSTKSNMKEDSTMQLTPYLLFDGTCSEAMTFYQSIFGGELKMTTVGDSPMKAAFPESMHAKIVSARLKSNQVELSASDWLRPAQKAVLGNTVCLYLSGGTADETKSLFEKLSVGADVTDPLADRPFGRYGALNDKFGNRWMFHSDAK